MVPATDLSKEYEKAEALLAQGDIKGAADLCQRILSEDPGYAYGYYLMAALFMRTGNLEKALLFINMAIERMPDNGAFYVRAAEIHMQQQDWQGSEAIAKKMFSLSKTLADQKKYKEALELAIKVTHVSPNDREAYRFVGTLMLNLNMPDAAMHIFRNLLLSKPDDIEAIFSVIHALITQLKNDEAALVAEQGLTFHPHNEVLQYYASMLRGKNVEKAPEEYVAKVFDTYADRFDTHLQHELLYKTPSLIADRIRSLPQTTGKSSLSLLDLGCGTGLAAEALRDITKLRVGVDLSPRMLEKAKDKQLYSELYQGDIVTFMRERSRQFDLVVAADVLVYVGDLAPFFKATRKSLAPEGLLAFSIEIENEGESYRLHDTGRYSHRIPYVLSLAQAEGYTCLIQENTVIRLQKKEPVQGAIFVFKKSDEK